MTITQKNFKVTYAELKGFQKALELIAMAEKYPTQQDPSMSLPPNKVSQVLSKLGICVEEELKPSKADVEKVQKKYKPHTDEEGEFLKGKEKEAGKFTDEIVKVWDTEIVAMLPVLPPLEEWDDFNISFRAISLLDKLFKSEEEESK